MKELQKFQNSTFDELTRQKFIEDQKFIMELSGRLQELQNEVNCMNDSKDFQDAESSAQWKFTRYQSTNVFPSTSSFWRIIEAFIHSAATHWWAAKYLGYIRYIRKRFCTSTDFISSVSSRIEFYMEENYWRTKSHVYSGEKWKTRTRSRFWEETILRIKVQTNNDCRFRISILTSSLRQLPLLAWR